MNKELIFFLKIIFPPFMHNFVYKLFFISYEKDIEIDKPSYSCDKSVMHNGNL